MMDILTDEAILILHGDFNGRSTWQVRAALYEHLHDHDEDVVVDLSDVGSVDMPALRVLAMATRRAHEHGHHLTLRGCSPAVRRMLHLSKLYGRCEVEGSALSSLPA